MITHLLSPGENPDIEEQVLKEICKIGNDDLLRKILKKGVVFPAANFLEPINDLLEILNKAKLVLHDEHHHHVREILKAADIVWKESSGNYCSTISHDEFCRNVKLLAGCLNARMGTDSITAVQYAVRRKKWDIIEILLNEDAILNPDPSPQYREPYANHPVLKTFVSLEELKILAKSLQETNKELQNKPTISSTSSKDSKDMKEEAEISVAVKTPKNVTEEEAYKSLSEKLKYSVEQLNRLLQTILTQIPKISSEQLRSLACFRVLTLFTTSQLDTFVEESERISTFRILLRHLIIDVKTAAIALEHFPKVYGKKAAPLKSAELSLDEAESSEEPSEEAAKIMIQCQLALSGQSSFEGSLLASNLLQIMGIEDTLKDVMALSSKTAAGVIVNCLKFFKSRYTPHKDNVFLTQKKALTFSSSLSSSSCSSSSSSLTLITTPPILSASTSVSAPALASAEQDSSSSSSSSAAPSSSNLSTSSNSSNVTHASTLPSASNISSVSSSSIDDTLLSSSTTHHSSVSSTSSVVSCHHSRGDSVLGKRDIDAVASDTIIEPIEPYEDTASPTSKKLKT